MASEVTVVNIALTLLGAGRIVSLDDDVKNAREAKALWETTRDATLAANDWNFAKTRDQLTALTDAPPFQFANKFQLPSDCLRLMMLGDYYTGLDLTDYRGAPNEDYTIEGRELLTNFSSPLNIRYIARVTDVTLWDPCFIKTLGAQLAMDLCEPLTQSDTKYQKAERQYRMEINNAIRANAICLPPRSLADDSWLMSRL